MSEHHIWEKKKDDLFTLSPDGAVINIHQPNCHFHHTSSSHWYKSEELPYFGL